MIRKLLTFTLLPLVVFSATPKRNASSFLVYADGEVPSKTIYVDFSNNTKFLEEGSAPYLKYKTDKDYKVSLFLDKDNIYKTETNIPLSVFSNDKQTFEIHAFNGTYKTAAMKGGSTSLKNDFYDYILLGSYEGGSTATIEGYGIYNSIIVENPGATYETQRIWLCDSSLNDKSLEYAVGFDNNSQYQVTPMSKITNSYDSVNYYYVDIPYEQKSLHFLKISNVENHNYLINQDFPVSYIMYGACYFGGSTEDAFKNIHTEVVRGADYIILGLVVEAYLTYGRYTSNGCTNTTVSTLEKTWFKEASATKEQLKENKISDYSGYSKNGNSYEGLLKDSLYSINEKWNTMKSQAGIGAKTNFFDKLLSAKLFPFAIIGGSALVIIVLVLILMVCMNKKKRKNMMQL